MSWDFFTWLSICVLIFGSVAVFIWFLRDVGQVYRQMREGVEESDR